MYLVPSTSGQRVASLHRPRQRRQAERARVRDPTRSLVPARAPAIRPGRDIGKGLLPLARVAPSRAGRWVGRGWGRGSRAAARRCRRARRPTGRFAHIPRDVSVPGIATGVENTPAGAAVAATVWVAGVAVPGPAAVFTPGHGRGPVGRDGGRGEAGNRRRPPIRWAPDHCARHERPGLATSRGCRDGSAASRHGASAPAPPAWSPEDPRRRPPCRRCHIGVVPEVFSPPASIRASDGPAEVPAGGAIGGADPGDGSSRASRSRAGCGHRR